jgi:hypothetical protein
MSGKRDKAVIAIISNLTSSQQAAISADLMKSKDKHAPFGRGTISACTKDSIGIELQDSIIRIGK